ncbi:hypothetical protein QUF75_14625 [Desulfococcaceae bacterium HSG7]|nr:hypothetical protein [Desulfococcaceae bacterium HSG7]
MNIIEICKKNALIFSEEVCRLSSQNGIPFPEYFDWSDHIAVSEPGDYIYHLNKTVIEVEKLIVILKACFPDLENFQSWEKDWLSQVLAAAWIHDIGMLSKRARHGIKSAEILLGENDWGFDFNAIGDEDRVKIGMLCIKHNNGWPAVYEKMEKIIKENNLSINILEQSFEEDKNTPNWQLDFSGKLISTADSLRYRGYQLRNDLKHPFALWSECDSCHTMYKKRRDFCSTNGCDSKPKPTAVINYDFDHKGSNPQKHPDIAVYQTSQSDKCKQMHGEINNNSAYVRVRDKNQLYTRGDMSLFDVSVIDSEIWKNNLVKNGIDCRKLDDYFLDEYKTVVCVTLDIYNLDAAMFTLSKYIVEHLYENLTAEPGTPHLIFSNNTILHLQISDGSVFSDYFKMMRTNRELAYDVQRGVSKFDTTFIMWQEHDIVLPVESIDNRIEVISL